MKLFLREHLLLIAVQLVQFVAILSLCGLDGYFNVWIALYAIFIGFFFLGCYLCYQFVSRRRYYQRLNQPLESLDASYRRLEKTPVSDALEQLLHTQYRYYMQQLEQLIKQQEEHLTFMDQWVHQMKTPLSIIELTVQNMDEPEFASIREELERMRSGLQTVLYMARLRAFEQDFHVKSVGLERIIRAVVHDNKRLFIQNRIYPEVHVAESGIAVETDEKWLFFMLTQLVTNAIKYSAGQAEDGGRIVISCGIRGEEAFATVKDRGIGIPAADLKRVFEPFYTGDNGRTARESTGMGLYLTKEAAARLGHRVDLSSEAGSGTEVSIVFGSFHMA
ncbi:sensor histidine kinase [Paenibacillus donghaensis]|uniref:histidine kinase n=1 Tax=Paenibacillus donghaensis TaxID=414771 RepID=A0A2Z2KPW8_9BACL|nr:sensor histidine kinase [Paenibacillus donghaensis]ASA24729.1 hypothetical protein B9T62_30615 [Paenibacillus donghaensis]